jgi:hypothetical protein
MVSSAVTVLEAGPGVAAPAMDPQENRIDATHEAAEKLANRKASSEPSTADPLLRWRLQSFAARAIGDRLPATDRPATVPQHQIKTSLLRIQYESIN